MRLWLDSGRKGRIFKESWRKLPKALWTMDQATIKHTPNNFITLRDQTHKKQSESEAEDETNNATHFSLKANKFSTENVLLLVRTSRVSVLHPRKQRDVHLRGVPYRLRVCSCVSHFCLVSDYM